VTTYDPKMIYKFATRLYSRAQALVLVYTLAGALVGAGLGKIYAAYAELSATPSRLVLGAFGLNPNALQPNPSPTNWTLIGALTAGLLGFWIGWNKAFLLKLQAQMALCQAKIEENTSTALART
jgi:hypothetical protein